MKIPALRRLTRDQAVRVSTVYETSPYKIWFCPPPNAPDSRGLNSVFPGGDPLNPASRVCRAREVRPPSPTRRERDGEEGAVEALLPRASCFKKAQEGPPAPHRYGTWRQGGGHPRKDQHSGLLRDPQLLGNAQGSSSGWLFVENWGARRRARVFL